MFIAEIDWNGTFTNYINISCQKFAGQFFFWRLPSSSRSAAVAQFKEWISTIPRSKLPTSNRFGASSWLSMAEWSQAMMRQVCFPWNLAWHCMALLPWGPSLCSGPDCHLDVDDLCWSLTRCPKLRPLGARKWTITSCFRAGYTLGNTLHCTYLHVVSWRKYIDQSVGMWELFS